MADIHEKIVDFETYCPKCKNYELEEYKDPCNSCLNQPTNNGTVKPWNFEEKKDDKNKRKG